MWRGGMVKKKGKAKTRKKRTVKKKQRSSFAIATKRFIIQIVIAFIGFICLFFLYDYFYPEKIEEAVMEQQEIPISSIEDIVSSTGSISLAGAEIPLLKNAQKEQIIYHEGYTVSYNSDYKIANWVAWDLTKEEAQSTKATRSNKFTPDPKVKGATALNEDYTRTGFDRGHLAPAGDMKWSAKAMRESFYFSNICPQHPKLNQGLWKTLEEKSRGWAIDYDTLLVVAGPVVFPQMRVMGKNRVGVPDSFYKVICIKTKDSYKGIGFLFDNEDCKKKSLKDYAVSIDSVEKVTGIDFFYLLPDIKEQEMESEVDFSYWYF